MKISVKVDEPKHPHEPAALVHLRAKLPVTIFNLPFLSHISTVHPSDLSLSLSTNFPSFPSLKLSYHSSSSSSPTLTLKSGTGLFGSPTNSPLIISAHFSLNPTPSFSLSFKPHLGSFSLRKSIFSPPPPNTDSGSTFGFVPVERPPSVKELPPLQSNVGADKDSVFKGVRLAASTRVPLGERAALQCRWWVGFAEDRMPVLRINKIGIRRVGEVVVEDEEVLRGMCDWMRKEVEWLTRANREMRFELEEMKGSIGSGGSGGGEFRERVVVGNYKGVKMAAPSHSSGFEEWRSKRKNKREGEESGKKEEKKSGGGGGGDGQLAFDMENELQRAIKAAAGAGAGASPP